MDNLKLLKDIKSKLQSEIPGTIDKVILFGSRVKGNATEFSDYDVLVIVKEYDWKLKNKIYNLIYDFESDFEIFIDVKVISLPDMNTVKGKQPFILDALDYGIAV